MLIQIVVSHRTASSERTHCPARPLAYQRRTQGTRCDFLLRPLDGGLAPRTVLHLNRTLSKAPEQATDDGLVPRNAGAPVKPTRTRIGVARAVMSAPNRRLRRPSKSTVNAKYRRECRWGRSAMIIGLYS